MIINKILLGDINYKNDGSYLEIGISTFQYIPVLFLQILCCDKIIEKLIYRKCRMIIIILVIPGDIMSNNAGSVSETGTATCWHFPVLLLQMLGCEK